jgi:hypothetical protein
MKVVIDEQGRGWLQMPLGNLVGFCNGKIGFCYDCEHPVKEITFPPRLFASHLLAGSCQHPYDPDVVRLLKQETPAYLMPRFLAENEAQVLLTQFMAKTVSPEAVRAFFPFWEKPKEYLKMTDTTAEVKKEKKIKAPKAPKAPKEPKAPKAEGIGAFSKNLILEGFTNAEILAKIVEKFPEAKTTAGCIAYYRNALKKAAKNDEPAEQQAA